MSWAVPFSMAPALFDPGDYQGSITSMMTFYALHDALLKPMPGRAMAPALAESWSLARDGQTYEFLLRKNATFHNGDPVTAADVKFSLERYRGTAAKRLKDKIAAVEVLDPHRMRVRLKEPWPDFMTFFGTRATGAGWVVPKSYLQRVGDGGFQKAPVGAGPYRFVSFTPGLELVLEAHDGYWRKAPAVRRLVFALSPPVDIARYVRTLREYAPTRYELMVNAYGGTPDDDPDYYRAIAPLAYADGIKTPVLLIHGLADMVAPPEHSQWIHEALRKSGNLRARLELLPGLGHFFEDGGNGYRVEKVAELTVDWFDETLGERCEGTIKRVARDEPRRPNRTAR